MRILLALAILVALPARAAPTPAKNPARSAAARFRALVAREYAWRLAHDGRTDEDDDRIAPHLPDVRPAAQAERLAYLAGVARALEAIPATALPARDQADAAVYRYQIATMLAHQRFRTGRCRSIRIPASGAISATPREGVIATSATIAPGSRSCANCRAGSTTISPTCAPASRAASPRRA